MGLLHPRMVSMGLGLGQRLVHGRSSVKGGMLHGDCIADFEVEVTSFMRICILPDFFQLFESYGCSFLGRSCRSLGRSCCSFCSCNPTQQLLTLLLPIFELAGQSIFCIRVKDHNGNFRISHA